MASPGRTVPFNQNGPINTSAILVRTNNRPQDGGIGFRRIRIERDHLAARVPFKDRDHQLRADPQFAADKLVLSEAAAIQVHVDVGPEPPLVDGDADLVGELAGCLQ